MNKYCIMSVLAGFSLPTTLIAQSAPRQPNVVIIVADDLGYGDLAVTGLIAYRLREWIVSQMKHTLYARLLYGGYFYPQPVFLAYRIISLDK